LGWFIIDFVSIFPFDVILNLDQGVNNLLRIAKLPKLTRFLRLARLVRMLRFLKQGNKLARYFNDWLRFRPGIDRFIMISAFFFIFCHLACCAWYLQATLGNSTAGTWIDEQDLEGKSNLEVSFWGNTF